ncbi:aminoglycoside phosphotransferase [Bacillus cereus]|uniref:phosphotransferase enzyme family protein n=1 Tax=Bacillus cereus TaxID=1396 RepID=UPI000BF311B2|nr:phosphotransferase [Bacillus cereus]PFR27445.1 aminoglycoside phosphotransferase [Bacillus cereus]
MEITNELLVKVLSEYGLVRPEITFLKHNENKTYKVTDLADGCTYLFRIHQPFTENFSGLQHTKEGLISEIQLLIDIANDTDLVVQTPIKNSLGKFIVEFDYEKTTIMTSLAKWIDGRNLNKEDFSNPKIVKELGTQTAKLHRYLRAYNRALQQVRPNYGEKRIDTMIQQIYRGIEKGLFSRSNFHIVEQTLNLISSRLVNLQGLDAWGIIHGDLNMSNVLITELGGVAFIDYGLFGYGYYLFDVAMGALNSTATTRNLFFEGYFGKGEVPEDALMIVEGFMLMSVLGYYAFQMENEKVHPWIRERMPLLCTKHCLPFLNGDRILYNF